MKRKPEEFIGKMVMITASSTIRLKEDYTVLEEGYVGLCVGYNRNVVEILWEEKFLSVYMDCVVGFTNHEILSGYSFCLTGEVTYWRRPLLIKVIEFLGGSVVKSAKKATHILRGDIKNSLKLAYAENEGIPILTKEDFFRLTEDALLIGRDIPWFVRQG